MFFSGLQKEREPNEGRRDRLQASLSLFGRIAKKSSGEKKDPAKHRGTNITRTNKD